MRRRATAGLGLVAAVSLAVAMGLRYSVREPLLVAAVFTLTVLVVAAYRGSRGRRTDVVRATIASITGMVTLLGTFSAGCDDVGDVSDWQRCRSLLGTPILEWPRGPWPIVFPLLLSTGVGVLTWWLVGAPDDRRT